MKHLTRAEAAGFLLTHEDFCILTHRNPDGDTIGSAAALCLGLRKLGKRAWVLHNPEITPLYAPFLEGLTKETPTDGDTIVCVDVAAAGMLPKCFASLADRCVLRIDHHGSATSFTDEELVDPDSASCAELVCDVLTILGVELDQKIAEAVYVGISTDTGCFRFPNTTPHSLMVASVCMRSGAPVHELNRLLFDTHSLAKLRLQGWVVEHMQLLGDGKYAIAAIPKALEEQLGITEDDMGNISSFLRSVEGVCMAVTLRQTHSGGTKLSVRAIPGYDAAALCAKFGGGGHKGAAGATTNMPPEEAAKAVADVMMKL